MRKNRRTLHKDFRILTLDDDVIMTSTLQAYFQRSGYYVDVINDPYLAIKRVREGNYDILLLDFLMTPICGDQVVEEIRKFDKDIYIILLTGHKSMAPPIKTIRELDIQGYYEKSDRFDQLELLVESCVKSISQMRIIQNYKSGLSQIMESLPQLYDLDNTQSIFESILRIAQDVFQGEGAFLMMPGMQENGDAAIHVIGNIRKEDVPGIVENNRFDGQTVICTEDLMLAAIEDEKHEAIGVLGTAMCPGPEYVQVQMLEIYTRQISSAIHNSQLHRLVSAKNEELTRAYEQLNESYVEIINAMRTVVDERDIYTRGHSDRVSDLAADLAEWMKKDKRFVDRVRLAGLFHDIGKVGISDKILMKPDKLDDQEYENIKKHSDKGAKILSAITLFNDVVPIVRHHHERIDGRGYPDRLKGDEIPEESKIIAVADSFDAMTSHRHYRSNLSLQAAVEELEKGKGTQFAPHVVDAFLEMLESMGEEKFGEKYDTGKESGEGE